jgi:hypothetical protein
MPKSSRTIGIGGSRQKTQSAGFMGRVEKGAVTLASRWVCDMAFAASPQSGLPQSYFLFPLIELTGAFRASSSRRKVHGVAHGKLTSPEHPRPSKNAPAAKATEALLNRLRSPPASCATDVR